MEAVKKGGDRQKLHEKIRAYSVESEVRYKQTGEEPTLIELISADPDFRLSKAEMESILDPTAFIGLAPRQTELFLERFVRPILDENTGVAVRAELNV